MRSTTRALTASALAISLGATAFGTNVAAASPAHVSRNQIDDRIEAPSTPAEIRALLDSLDALPNGLSASRLVPRDAAEDRIAEKLDQRRVSPYVGNNIAVQAVDVATGETIYGHRTDAPLLGASNMKIVTAMNVLEALGPDHRFVTKVTSESKGQLSLVAGGDPLLTAKDVTKLATQTAQYVKDNDLLPDVVTPDPYRPTTCVAKARSKRLGRTVMRRSTSTRPCPIVQPASYRPAIKMSLDTSMWPSPKEGPGYRSGYVPYVVRPVSPLGFLWSYTSGPSYDVGQTFVKGLADNGVKATFEGWQKSDANAQAVTEFKSQPLSEAVRVMLLVSENNIAEMLYRHTAAAAGLRPTWKNSRKAAMDSLEKLGIDTEGLALTSGSGVARTDRLTTKSLTQLLNIAADKDRTEFKPVYYGKGLPTAGYTGTLNGRFSTNASVCARGKVFAKTGTLFDTIGLSGLTTGASGRLISFSILINDRPQQYSPSDARNVADALAATVNGCN